MIRVLQYIGSLEQGGSQAMIMNLYRNVDRTQIQFDFVIHADGITSLAKEAQSMGSKIYSCPVYRLKTVRTYSKWWKVFFQEHPEYKVVHSHVRSTAAIVLSIAKKNGCKTIAHSHSTSSGSGMSAIVKNVLQYRIRYVADYFMGCSQEAGEWLFGKRVCSSDRYYTLPNAVDVGKYIYNAEIAREVRAEFKYTEQDIVIGHVGRFSEPKNHLFLIDVFNSLHAKDERYKLLLVGDGELRQQIRTKIQLLGLDESVLMTGVRQDVDRIMMAMDMFLFPSKWEGLPVSVVEAQASGLPCVISSNITEEVCLTSLVRKHSLNSALAEWVSVVEEALKYGRNNECKENLANYDIKKSVIWITDFYRGLYES